MSHLKLGKAEWLALRGFLSLREDLNKVGRMKAAERTLFVCDVVVIVMMVKGIA